MKKHDKNERKRDESSTGSSVRFHGSYAKYLEHFPFLKHNILILFDTFGTVLYFILSTQGKQRYVLFNIYVWKGMRWETKRKKEQGCTCDSVGERKEEVKWREQEGREEEWESKRDRKTERKSNSAVTGTFLLPSDNDMAPCQILAVHRGSSSGRENMETTDFFFIRGYNTVYHHVQLLVCVTALNATNVATMMCNSTVFVSPFSFKQYTLLQSSFIEIRK